MQFKAGYIVDAIAKVITDFKATLNKKNPSDQTKLDHINGLLQYVSSFDVEFPYDHSPDFKNLNPVLATLNNIVTRGLPTRAPITLEQVFSEINLTDPNINEYELNYPSAKKKITFETIFQLLHILEPKLEISKSQYGGFPGSFSEWKFLDETLKDFPFAKQILQSQRDFATIGKGIAGGKTVDFSFEFPYQNPKRVGTLTDKQRQGIIFEFDGPHHQRQDIKYYDKYRDDAADEDNFETLRQASDLSLNPSIGDKFKEDIFKIFETNYHRNSQEYLEAYSLLFIPLAVARIQKTILELFLRNKDLLEKETLKIAIIERDLPCGAIAIKSLQDYFENINAILEDKDKLTLPKIGLTIFENKNWVTDNKIHLNDSIKNEEYFKLTNFDIIIDHSILRRSDIYNGIDFKCENAIKIRSSHFFDTNNGRKIYCANLLNYKSLVEKKDDGSYISKSEYKKNINFFIQNIFRKTGFRDGQLPIISRALQQKPVIGLLPTGGGKSLTFQLPTFLQPGLCLIVDPIKSLMEDQVRVLKQNWIDCCEFINSNDNRQDKTKKLIDFRFGETMFLFVSPERFVMEDFRSIIKNIETSKFSLAFSYCVIDEVHCVSEWGHDFRTTYLMLGKNAQKFAANKNQNPVSLIGLTATASFDVLTDIERELKINADDSHDAIISIDNTIRPELFFCVFENTVTPTTFPVKEQELKDTIGFGKQIDLNSFYDNILDELSKIDSNVISEGIEQHYTDFEILENSNQKEIDKKKEEAFQKINKSFIYEDKNNIVSIVFMPHITGTYGIMRWFKKTAHFFA